jgi:hypothetical protein
MGRAAYSGGWRLFGGHNMSENAGSVTTQSMGFQNVIVPYPLQLLLIFKTGHGRFVVQFVLLFINSNSTESKMLLSLTYILLDSGQNDSKICKILDLFIKNCIVLWYMAL